MATLVPVNRFMDEADKAVDRHDGYIMGASGQDPKKWSKTSWWYTQYSGKQKEKALYWREHAQRVWDCNGLAEGIYKDFTGEDINTKARYNYANWCNVKGAGMIPVERRVRGAAVFWSDGKATDIHHVAYLSKPVVAGKPEGDWYIDEARGVMYGCVRTRLLERKPNFWGWMDKKFDYTNADAPMKPTTSTVTTLRKGDKGDAVKLLQQNLMKLGYALPKYKDDGDFGTETENAVKAFQKDNKLEVELGVVGKNTFAAIEAMIEDVLAAEKNDGEPVEKEEVEVAPVPEVKVQFIKITTGSWYIREGAGTNYKALGTVKAGGIYPVLEEDENGWCRINAGTLNGWISPKGIIRI